MTRIGVPQRRLKVIQLLPALNAGGVERATLEIGKALVANGHHSMVVSAGGRLTPRLVAAGSEHITLDIDRKSLWTLRHIWTLKRLFEKIRPDIIHARSRLPGWLVRGALSAMGRSRPHFVTSVHGLNSPGIYSSVLTRGERVICVSNTVRDYVLRHYPNTDPNRLRVIARGIDANDFPFGYQPDEAWCSRFFKNHPQFLDIPLLTLPGRGTRLKGHHAAIELLAALKACGTECGLLLLGAREAGREKYVSELEQLATARGVAERVVLTPPRDDVCEIYAVSALILQLSNKPEAFGRTVLEALSLGRPVLGYAHGGVGELLAELYPAGRTVPGDQAQLVERTLELLRKAPSIAPLTAYRLDTMQQATLALYGEIAGI